MYTRNIIVGPQGADQFKTLARTRLQNKICTRRCVPSIRSGEGQDYGEHAVRNGLGRETKKTTQKTDWTKHPPPKEPLGAILA